MKRTAFRIKGKLPRLLNKYSKGHSILRLSREVNYPPSLLARYMVEAMTDLKSKKLTAALRDPTHALNNVSVIAEQYRSAERVRPSPQSTNTTTRLAIEVQEAIAADPLNSPMREKGRHCVGVEYEVVLEHYLRSMSK